jgi:hypothetical protein
MCLFVLKTEIIAHLMAMIDTVNSVHRLKLVIRYYEKNRELYVKYDIFTGLSTCREPSLDELSEEDKVKFDNAIRTALRKCKKNKIFGKDDMYELILSCCGKTKFPHINHIDVLCSSCTYNIEV